MNKITVSAPGKLMLLGEYAVVCNKPCLVTAVDKRLYATVEIIDNPELQLEAEDVGIVGYRKSISELGKGSIPKGVRFAEMAVKNILELFLRHSGLTRQTRLLSRISQATAVGDSGVSRQVGIPRMTVGVRITTRSDFLPKFGFGSSSAATVCVIRAISQLFNLGLSKKELFDISYKTVLDIQGRGSGFDVAAAVYGGTLYFVTGGKLIESLDIKSLPLVVGYSGVKADTVKLINKVKKDFSNKRNHLEKIYNGIEILVNQGKATLVKMAWKKLGTLMNQNQDYLRKIGVSTAKLDRMVRSAVNAGAYGAKLSGAGGGDCMIALVGEENRNNVKKALENAGGEVVDVKTGEEGVRLE